MASSLDPPEIYFFELQAPFMNIHADEGRLVEETFDIRLDLYLPHEWSPGFRRIFSLDVQQTFEVVNLKIVLNPFFILQTPTVNI